MINPQDLRSLVVFPTLHRLSLWCPASEQIVMAAAAQASALARLRTDGGRLAAGHSAPGEAEPAGLWGITPSQHRQVLAWLKTPAGAEAAERLPAATGVQVPSYQWVVGNLHYGAAIVRLLIARTGCGLPDPADLAGIAAFAGHWLGPTHRAGLQALGRLQVHALREALAANLREDLLVVGG